MDHTAPIFDKSYLYGCYVPYGSTIPAEEIAEFGLRATGVEELDERLADVPTKVWITINDMVELFRGYYPISIISSKDAHTVYETIVEYTGKWRTYLSTYSLNQSRLPVDDLIVMEEFATHLRTHALEGVQTAKVQRSITSVLSGILPRSTQHQADSTHDTELLELFKNYKRNGGVA